MKLAALAIILVTVSLVWLGTPFVAQPAIDHHYGSPAPILPMTFAHKDHTQTACLTCHHNYVDDTGNETCMACHVSHAEVWPQLEAQFHELCRGCHEDLAAQGEASGPVRACQGCHLADALP